MLERVSNATSDMDGTAQSIDADANYGEAYYASHCGPIPYSRTHPEWEAFFGGVADNIVSLLRPRRVFDAGCAHGFLVEALWDRGVEAWGRDISSFAVSQVRADIQSFVSQGSIAEQLGGTYDLVTCIEVLEHMPEAEAVKAIAAMAEAAPRILFSSSPTDLEEPTHVNVKPIRWWLDRFAEVGFAPVPDIDASFLTPHAFVVERSESGRSARALTTFAALMRMRMSARSEMDTIRALRGELAQLTATATEASAVADAAKAEISRIRAEGEALKAEISRMTAEGEAAKAEISRMRAEGEALKADRQRLAAVAQAARNQVSAFAARLRTLEAERQQITAAAEASQIQLAATEQHLSAIMHERDAIMHERNTVIYSTVWRATRPVRTLANALPAPVRRTVRRGARLLYWTATLQLPRRLQERRHARRIMPPQALLPVDVPPQEVEAPLPPALPGHAADPQHYARWVAECDALGAEDRVLIRTHIERLPARPLISVVMPAYETPEPLLREAINSVRAQIYTNWELCVVDDASPSGHVARLLEEAAAEDPRIRWVRRPENGNISAASNTALDIVQGDFVALLDHDDRLAEQALYEIAVVLNEHPEADIVFSDEDRFDDESGRRHSPYFKPGWDPDLILGQNSISHLGVYRRALLERIGGFRTGFEGSQDHDLVLRAVLATSQDRIRHVPAVLYHWRLRGDASFSDTQLARCVEASRRAVAEHIRALPGGKGAEVLPHPTVPSYHRIRWPLPEKPPRVSIIVPTRNRAELLERCTTGILQRTDYPDFELLVMDNGSTEPAALDLLAVLAGDERVRVQHDEGPFNYSALNNRAARQATGEILLLLNNDIDVLDGGWLREMVSHVLRPGVGTVGARLLYPDGTVQHAGVVLGVGSFAEGPGVAGHFGLGDPAAAPGYFAHNVLTRTVSANTAACLAVRRDLYLELGGLDEVNLPVAFNDVDFGLRVRERGLRNVWTPFAELLHLESASRGKDITPEQQARANRECQYMRDRWGPLLDSDPYYNVNLSRIDHMHRLPIPGRRTAPWRRAAMEATA